MKSLQDLSGKQFGRWTVLHFHSKQPTLSGGTCYRWLCRCSCGEEKPVLSAQLKNGTSQSCGCLHREQMRAKNTPRWKKKHRRAYGIWLSMKTRCRNLTHPSAKNYGQRGIEICPEWEGSFETFIRDMGDPPDGYWIERKDNNGHYCKENCIWADRQTQQQNKRNNLEFDWKGETLCLAEIARMENCRYNSLRNYIMISGLTLREGIDVCRQRGLTWVDRANRGVRTEEIDWSMF